MPCRTRAILVAFCIAPLVAAATTVQLPSGKYIVDSARSKVTSRVAYFGVSRMNVTFPTVSGSLAYDANTPQSIKLDVNVDATTLNAGSNWNNEKLRGSDFFNTDVYKTIFYRGTRLTITGPKTATVDGEMTVRGITQPSSLAVTFASSPADIAQSSRVALTARTKIKRSQFGMKAYSLVVGEEVSLDIAVEFVRL